jgi:hypothetical protein
VPVAAGREEYVPVSVGEQVAEIYEKICCGQSRKWSKHLHVGSVQRCGFVNVNNFMSELLPLHLWKCDRPSMMRMTRSNLESGRNRLP